MAERAMIDALLNQDKDYEYSMLWPWKTRPGMDPDQLSTDYMQGDMRPAVPGIIADFYNSMVKGGQMIQGERKIDPFEVFMNALDFAPSGVLSRIPSGSLGMGALTRGPRNAKNRSEGTISKLNEAPPSSDELAARRYIPNFPPETKIDPKSGKEYLGKVVSPEGEAVAKKVKAAQKDIDAGNYTPYYDVSQRFDVDPSKYPAVSTTILEASPKTSKSLEKYDLLANNPEARARIEKAFSEGEKILDSDRWYLMGQLEKSFIDELGEEAGRKAFKEKFAESMAATTGGADPTSNLRMAAYGNFIRQNDLDYPKASYEMPYPIGGRYAMGNIDMHRKLMDAGEIAPGSNPKRHNFARNFLGDTDPSTIDEQMSNLFDPKMNQPPGSSYGAYEASIADMAQKAGVNPRDYQDVAWAGAKKLKNESRGNKYPGSKPMIQIVNEAIERTSRVTGQTPDEVVKEALINSNSALYSSGSVTVPMMAKLFADSSEGGPSEETEQDRQLMVNALREKFYGSGGI